jgi:iron complex transport system substrate-binding protein
MRRTDITGLVRHLPYNLASLNPNPHRVRTADHPKKIQKTLLRQYACVSESTKHIDALSFLVATHRVRFLITKTTFSLPTFTQLSVVSTMKLLCACALLFLQATVVTAGNPTACLAASEVVDGTDYFPDKAVVDDATQWTVEYFDTYKIVVNVPANERYLLYQCGTVNDTATLLDGMQDTDFAAIVPIPLTEVGLLYTTMVPFMELLGLRTSISAILSGSAAYVSSPCVQVLVSDGTIEDVPYMDPPDVNATNVTAVEIAVEVAFVGQYGDSPEVASAIRVSETAEATNMAVLEWIKFYSLFFNLEAKANELYSQAKDRQLCVEGNAVVATSDMADADLPTVLWGQYSDYCGGWEIARNCPDNYYCQMAASCSANLLWSEEGSHTNPELCFDGVYMTTEEFVAFGSQAEYFIYVGPGWEETMAMFGTELSEFVSVKSQQVYDYQGLGPNAWFEQRLVEPGTCDCFKLLQKLVFCGV